MPKTLRLKPGTSLNDSPHTVESGIADLAEKFCESSKSGGAARLVGNLIQKLFDKNLLVAREVAEVLGVAGEVE